MDGWVGGTYLWHDEGLVVLEGLREKPGAVVEDEVGHDGVGFFFPCFFLKRKWVGGCVVECIGRKRKSRRFE